MSTAVQSPPQPPEVQSPRRKVPLRLLIVRAVITLIAVLALASPIWVALHGTSFLNQAPPPYWQMNVGTGGAAHRTGPAGFGGC